MTVFNVSTGGSRIVKGSFPKTAYTDPDPLVEITSDVYEAVPLDGVNTANQETARRVVFKAGQIVRQSKIDALYPTPTNIKAKVGTGTAYAAAASTSVSLLAAGGQTVTITADRALLGVSAVNFGGTAGTSLTVIDDRTLTVVSPAKAAGPHALAIVDDSGTVTWGNVTYV
jgi:hypothetical protein